MKTAVIILNWCNATATIHCVETLLEYSDFDGPICVVDNASPDGSFEVLTNSLPGCTVLRNNTNSGYTGGNNYGLRWAFDNGCDAVLILNNDVDVQLKADFWDWLEAAITSYPMSLVGVPVSRSERGESFAFPAPHGTVTRSIVETAGLDLTRMPEMLCGCAMVVPRQLYELVGGLNEDFFMYCEEFEYSLRSVRGGGCVMHSPPELGFVVRQEMAGDRAPYVYYYQARNLISLALEWSSSWRFKNVAMVILVSLKNAAGTHSLKSTKAAVLGIVHGFRGQHGRLDAIHELRSR